LSLTKISLLKGGSVRPMQTHIMLPMATYRRIK
jgi:hypothetical protein